MIPVLIIWLVKKYRQAGSRQQFYRIVLQKIYSLLPRIASLALVILLLFITLSIKAQTRELSYMILNGPKSVGNIHFTETNTTDGKQLKMESEIKGKILFIPYSGSAKEEAVYRNGVLVHSSIYRQMNGKEKANKQHQVADNRYVIQSGGNSEVSGNYPITYNMLSLYSAEPVNIHKVYSDNFQRFIEIKKMEAHKYKISLPDGNTNYYYYQDGLLVMVEAHSTWYSVMIILKK
ncbi:MAG TPA: DUF6134 family protein [Chitinophagaceae bacterium]|nr:DUF6134 family protein [Chitinophagaceae bacterium]